MGWDGTERRNDDHASRIASLEAYSRVQAAAITDLKTDLRAIRTGVEDVKLSITAARAGGRVFLAVAMALGGLVAWIVQLVSKT